MRIYKLHDHLHYTSTTLRATVTTRSAHRRATPVVTPICLHFTQHAHYTTSVTLSQAHSPAIVPLCATPSSIKRTPSTSTTSPASSFTFSSSIRAIQSSLSILQLYWTFQGTHPHRGPRSISSLILICLRRCHCLLRLDLMESFHLCCVGFDLRLVDLHIGWRLLGRGVPFQLRVCEPRWPLEHALILSHLGIAPIAQHSTNEPSDSHDLNCDHYALDYLEDHCGGGHVGRA